MWRARQTLHVVLGTHRLDFGVTSGVEWRQDSVGSIVFKPHIEAIPAAFDQLYVKILSTNGNEEDNEAQHSKIDEEKNELTQRIVDIPELRIDDLAIVISEAWLPVVTIPWNRACMNAATGQAYARSMLRTVGFDLSEGDEICIDDASFGEPRVVLAYPKSIVDALRGLAQQLNARIVSLSPLSVSAWQMIRRKRRLGQRNAGVSALAILDFGQVSIVRYDGGQLTHVATRSLYGPDKELGKVAAESALLDMWRRVQLRDFQAGDIHCLRLLDLDHPEEKEEDGEQSLIREDIPGLPESVLGAPSINRRLWFVRSVAGVRHPLSARESKGNHASARWIPVMLLALTVACGALFVAYRTTTSVMIFEDQLRHEQRSARIETLPTPAMTQEERKRVPSVNAAIRQMNLPVDDLLRVIVPPQDINVTLLGVDLAGKRPLEEVAMNRSSTIKVVAEAPTGGDMATYVAYLAHKRPFVAAYLVRHEVLESQADKPYRFTVEAEWRE